ncbi:NAD(P)H-dependent glycerol-3-phosphate dehydrogenase [Candidatus Symbiobacter mobilis]|uniref:Glycerol-3-phosphate dehydrogenase [NAD(P)+] n=1 Tax=Candidatus Symbiobacter mobilis CR TaxID=946483 RepID=U5N6A6_9BURK|nr:NAD(P)H-dependent glycerol-3-phosphate dehydrogenase [Candidatus Symbiobacter mobilis]AGX86892.1 glycerol-3-phosphate dehydrogenase [Candidatus Symbiobacter mobilis CR]
MKALVLGAGAWGTALALAAQRNGTAVTLCTRDAFHLRSLRDARENRKYLPGFALPDGLALALARDALATLPEAGCDLIVLATPVAGLRASLLPLRNVSIPLIWLCKGLESTRMGSGMGSGTGSAQTVSGNIADGNALLEGLLPHEVLAQVAPNVQAGVLSGPSFAQEVAAACPTALVAASIHAPVLHAAVAALHSHALRIYTNDDLIGVEVAGAVKNILAIAAGLCDGLGLGLNARAALITRGLAEMARFGVALGARADTFMGLSGMGDLILTSTGDLSRNRQVGLLLATGKNLAEVLAIIGKPTEGVFCARAVVERARHIHVDMPIAQTVLAVLEGAIAPQQAPAVLMERDPVQESPSWWQPGELTTRATFAPCHRATMTA